MPQASFVLKEPNGQGPTLVYLLYRFNGAKLKYSTSQKIAPKFWNSEKQRAKETKTFSEYAAFNDLLDSLEACVKNTYRQLLTGGTRITPELLRVPLDELLQKDNGRAQDLITFSKYWVENSDRKPQTKKQLKQAIRNLEEFKVASKRSMHFDSIDLDFYDDYKAFLLNKGYAVNTIGTLIKNLKVFMQEAVERGLTKNLQFKNKRFKTVEEPTETIYLCEKEIKKIYEKDLSDNPRLEKVRDLFVIGCYTGLRFSDLTSIRVENISKEKRVIKVRTQKTDELVIIPINSIVNTIIEKYNGELPTMISNQKMNEYLKELGKKAEIEETVLLHLTKGGKRETETYKKWELITTHTARRSFASNAYMANVPTISIMKITGHKTEKSFLKYIKISQEDNANKLINHPFFA